MVQPDDDLIRRFFDTDCRPNGAPHKGAFRLRRDEEGLSVSLRRMADIEALKRVCEDRQGLVLFSASIPLDAGLAIEHTPTDSDPSHHHIVGMTKTVAQRIAVSIEDGHSIIHHPKTRSQNV